MDSPIAFLNILIVFAFPAIIVGKVVNDDYNQRDLDSQVSNKNDAFISQPGKVDVDLVDKSSEVVVGEKKNNDYKQKYIYPRLNNENATQLGKAKEDLVDNSTKTVVGEEINNDYNEKDFMFLVNNENDTDTTQLGKANGNWVDKSSKEVAKKKIKDDFNAKNFHDLVKNENDKFITQLGNIDKLYENNWTSSNSFTERDDIPQEDAKDFRNKEETIETPLTNRPKIIDRKANKNASAKNNATLKQINENCIGQIEYCNLTKEQYIYMLESYITPQPYEWVLIATHSIVFVVGLIGNALVCMAVYRNHAMRTVTNYFIVNLAVADFMVILICLPPTVLWDVTETWFLGEGLCKIMLYFQSVSVTVSVLTLTFISIDRWYAICFPLKFKCTTGQAKSAIIIIWILGLLFNSPDLFVLTTVKAVPLRFDLNYLVQCMATWSQKSDLVWHTVKLIFIYTLPLMLMTVAYCQIVKVLWSSNRIVGQAGGLQVSSAEQRQLRSRRKAAKMLVAVVVMFAFCYFPVHLLSVLRYSLEMEQTEVVTCLALVSHVLCYANSAINPLIYNFMSGKYREEFRRTFCCSSRPQSELTTLSRIPSKRHFDSRKSYDMTINERGHKNCRHARAVCNYKVETEITSLPQ